MLAVDDQNRTISAVPQERRASHEPQHSAVFSAAVHECRAAHEPQQSIVLQQDASIPAAANAAAAADTFICLLTNALTQTVK